MVIGAPVLLFADVEFMLWPLFTGRMSPLVFGLMCHSFEWEECLPLLFGLFSMSSPCYAAQRFLCKLFALGDVDTYYDASFWTTITECFPPTKRAFWKCCPKLIHWKCQFCLLMRFVERQNWAFWKMFKCGCQYFLTWSYSLQQCSLIA